MTGFTERQNYCVKNCIKKQRQSKCGVSPLKSMSSCFYYRLATRRLFSKRALPIPSADIEIQAPETWFSRHDQENRHIVLKKTHKNALTIIIILSKKS